MLRHLILGGILAHLGTYTVQDVSVFGFFSGLYSVRMRENTDQENSNTGTFHAVIAEC